jgi:HlyD family secretion protein
VTFVSPDLVTSQTNSETWFVATVEVDASSLAARAGMHMQAGMPAELYVTTPSRSLFQYLAKPFMAFTSHALREP